MILFAPSVVALIPIRDVSRVHNPVAVWQSSFERYFWLMLLYFVRAQPMMMLYSVGVPPGTIAIAFTAPVVPI